MNRILVFFFLGSVQQREEATERSRGERIFSRREETVQQLVGTRTKILDIWWRRNQTLLFSHSPPLDLTIEDASNHKT